MKIAIIIRNPWFFRNVSTVIDELAIRGHTIALLMDDDPENYSGAAGAIAELLAKRPNIRRYMPKKWGGNYRHFDRSMSLALDRLHFGGKLFDDKPVIKARSVAKSTGPLLDYVSKPMFRNPIVRKAAMEAYGRLSEAGPPNGPVHRILQKVKPDVTLICPLIDVGHAQFGEARGARAVGSRVIAYVHSWDNLSSKSWLRRDLDAVIVWNEMQLREARTFHDFPSRKVHKCGAAPYDGWFEMKPTVSREDYLTALGLDPSKKTILYVGSALFRPPFGQHFEPEFLLPWVARVRASDDPVLRDANIIVRPHPKRRDGLAQEQFDGFANVRLWPPVATNPVALDKRMDYFHSLTHCDVVVGLNTSAFIESVLLDKPTLTVLDERFEMSQRGTFHFDWLIGRAGAPAMIRAADDIDAHFAELKEVVNGRAPITDSERRAVLDFVRPAGIDRRAVDVVCDEIEKQRERGKHYRSKIQTWIDNILLEKYVLPMSETKLAKRRSMRAYRAEMGMAQPPLPGATAADEATAAEAEEDEIAVAADMEQEAPTTPVRVEALEPRS